MSHRQVLAAALLTLSMAITGCAGGDSSRRGSTAEGAGAQAVPAEDLTWRIGVHPCAADCGFLRMAEKKGFYEEMGVDVEFVELQSASQALPALAAGEVDAIEQSPGVFFIAAQSGQMDAAVIGSTMHGLPYAIYAKREISSFGDLPGKSMAISSPTGLPALVANLMMRAEGVDPASVSQLNGGGNSDRYRAVVAGTADAASAPADFVPQAEADGVKVLGLSTDVIPDYPRYMIIARRDALEERPEAAQRYLAGLIKGLRYAYDNPDEAKQLAAEAMGATPDDAVVTYMHDLIVEKELVSRDADVMMDKLKYQQDVLLEAGELSGPLDMAALVDDSYRQEALALVGG